MIENDYSIEILVEKISIAKTRNYFKEVIQTFYSGAYRSCIVTLYSVVICDLIFKLEELRDIYNDSSAGSILKELAKKQSANPKSPDWETELIELIKERTSILELYEIDSIYQLQKQRHLSAHPVLSASSILYTPNKETITAHIKNMLLFVLTKPAFFSQKMASNIIDDIAENKDRLIIVKGLKRYLESKYFKNAKQELYNNLFKLLWKFTFKLNNDDCINNRDINLQVLNIVYNKDRTEIEKFIRSEQGFFDFITEEDIIKSFMFFLFDYRKIYSCLSQSTQILIDSEISKNEKFEFISWFKDDSFEEYFARIQKLVNEHNISLPSEYFFKVKELAAQFDMQDEFNNLAIELFGNSGSFSLADIRFSKFIEPIIADLDEKQIEKIIEKIDNNSQISGRRRASSDNIVIRKAMLKLNPNFDFSGYRSF